MSFGMMRTPIEIYSTSKVKDTEGFTTEEEQLLISIKAYKEEMRGSESGKNSATFFKATTLFRFRKPPGLVISAEHILVYKGIKYNITSVEDVMDKGMYLEVIAEKISGTKG